MSVSAPQLHRASAIGKTPPFSELLKTQPLSIDEWNRSRIGDKIHDQGRCPSRVIATRSSRHHQAKPRCESGRLASASGSARPATPTRISKPSNWLKRATRCGDDRKPQASLRTLETKVVYSIRIEQRPCYLAPWIARKPDSIASAVKQIR